MERKHERKKIFFTNVLLSKVPNENMGSHKTHTSNAKDNFVWTIVQVFGFLFPITILFDYYFSLLIQPGSNMTHATVRPRSFVHDLVTAKFEFILCRSSSSKKKNLICIENRKTGVKISKNLLIDCSKILRLS
jgi:hypothetical protein